MKKLSELFDIGRGHSLEFNRLKPTRQETGIPFVSRQRKNNGIAGYVRRVRGEKPNDPGEITCALNGQGGVMAAHLQERPYYTAFHVACLRPRVKMTRAQELYYCACLWANHYRYSWGRQADRTIKGILLPDLDEIPTWASDEGMDARLQERLTDLAQLSAFARSKLSQIGPERVQVRDLFKLKYGHSLELVRLQQAPDGVNFVSRTRENNGISAKVVAPDGIQPAPGGLISVACGGSVMETFLQLEPFYSGRDIYWLEAIENLDPEEKLFYCCCLRANRFRYHYGRQANKTLGDLLVPARSAIPEWVYGSIGRLAGTWETMLSAAR